MTPADTATVTGRISGENHPFVEHFKFVKQFEDENTVARQTMPSPAQTRFVLTGNAAAYPYDEFYKNDDELTADIVAAYRQVIADLYAAGCRNVQFDDCTWTRLCDASVRERLGWSDEDALRTWTPTTSSSTTTVPAISRRSPKSPATRRSCSA